MPPVFTSTASVTIAAPGIAVFSLLADRSTWSQWNPFVPRADLLSPKPDASASDSQDGHLQVGQQLKFHIKARILGRTRNVPGGSVEIVTVLETPDATGDGNNQSERGVWRVVWIQGMMPRWLMRTQRVNEVIEDHEEDGTVRTTYRTYVTFDGPFAWIVKYTMGWMVQQGLTDWAEGLKKAAEAR